MTLPSFSAWSKWEYRFARWVLTSRFIHIHFFLILLRPQTVTCVMSNSSFQQPFYFPSLTQQFAFDWVKSIKYVFELSGHTVRIQSYCKILSSITWRIRVRNSFFVPPSQLNCRLVCTKPPSCIRHTPTLVCMQKIPYLSVERRVGLTSRWYGNKEILHTEGGEGGVMLGSAVLWLLVFPGESSPNFLHCIGTRKLCNLD